MRKERGGAHFPSLNLTFLPLSISISAFVPGTINPSFAMKKVNYWHSIGTLVLVLAAGLFLATVAQAAEPLKSATVTQIGGQNKDVSITKEGAQKRAAVERDSVVGKDVLETGKKSRAELEFTDKSLARLGSNTIFSFDPGTRDMNLTRGTALIHVPPGLSGARISSPAATAAIRGDVVAMRVNERGLTQIVALSKDEQGPIKVTLNKTKEERILKPGEMMTIDPAAMKLPEPMTIAVDVFVQTNPLLNGQGMEKKEMPDTAQKEVKQTQEAQNKEIRNGNLENPGQLANDGTAVSSTQQGTDTASMLVQATQGGRFSGRFVGAGRDNPPSSYDYNMTIDVRADGTFTTTMINTSTGERDITTGNWSTDGSFSGSGTGGSVNGTFSQSATTLNGTYSNQDPSYGLVTGSYSTTKQ
jgi:hypothetical protein